MRTAVNEETFLRIARAGFLVLGVSKTVLALIEILAGDPLRALFDSGPALCWFVAAAITDDHIEGRVPQ